MGRAQARVQETQKQTLNLLPSSGETSGSNSPSLCLSPHRSHANVNDRTSDNAGRFLIHESSLPRVPATP